MHSTQHDAGGPESFNPMVSAGQAPVGYSRPQGRRKSGASKSPREGL